MSQKRSTWEAQFVVRRFNTTTTEVTQDSGRTRTPHPLNLSSSMTLWRPQPHNLVPPLCGWSLPHSHHKAGRAPSSPRQWYHTMEAHRYCSWEDSCDKCPCLLWAILCPPPQNSYVEALTTITSEYDCIWRWGLQGVIKLKWGHYGGPWSNSTGVFVRGTQGCVCTEGWPCEKAARGRLSASPGERPQKKLTPLAPWS